MTGTVWPRTGRLDEIRGWIRHTLIEKPFPKLKLSNLKQAFIVNFWTLKAGERACMSVYVQRLQAPLEFITLVSSVFSLRSRL